MERKKKRIELLEGELQNPFFILNRSMTCLCDCYLKTCTKPCIKPDNVELGNAFACVSKKNE